MGFSVSSGVPYFSIIGVYILGFACVPPISSNMPVAHTTGVPEVPWHPQILADQLTLSQPRGADYAHQIILTPSDFQTFQRPCHTYERKQWEPGNTSRPTLSTSLIVEEKSMVIRGRKKSSARKVDTAKGQLISKCLFGVFNSPNKRT
jgi:hypothetical protein